MGDPRTAALGRRDFLRRAAALPFLLGPAAALAGDDPPPKGGGQFPGLILRQREPENLEFPFPTLDAFITPNNLFYVRNHFPLPKIDVGAWRLKVEGAVEKPLELGHDELRKLPTRTQAVTLECAGNGRAFLVPQARGVGWELGAVGTAEWAGVPLAAVLERAGVRDAAVDVVLEGADAGQVADPP